MSSFPVTFSDLLGPSYVTSFLKCYFLYSSAGVDKKFLFLI